MQPATSSNRSLRINGMDSDSCIKKVTDALRDVKGVRIRSVSLGTAKIDTDQAGCDAACTAVSSRGFETREVRSNQKNISDSLKMNTGMTSQTPASQAAAKEAQKGAPKKHEPQRRPGCSNIERDGQPGE